METNKECPFCDKNAVLKSNVVEKEFKKEPFKITEFFYKCESCGEEFTTKDSDEVTINQAYNQYREKYLIPFPEELVKLRLKYGVSAQKMSQILGLGINTYSNYEKGEIPTHANAKLIASSKRPEVFLTYISQSKELFNPKAYARVEETIDNLIKSKEVDSFLSDFTRFNIPNKFTGYILPNPEKATNLFLYFLSNCNPDYNDKLKLNKLLFYADFLNYKVNGKSISGISYRAVFYGPVPANYDFLFAYFTEKDEIIESVFTRSGNSRVVELYKPLKEFDLSVFTREEIKTIDKIIALFKDTPSWDLVDLSHKEKAWIELNKSKSIISYQEYAFSLSIDE